jgi:predicted alpha/beta-fold hydrolase
MNRKFWQIAIVLIGLITHAGTTKAQMKNASQPDSSRVMYHTAQVDGLKIFYREAGPKNAPTLVLLHGFPSSSHMFRELIPRLSDKYHVVAPDYPGYGYSDSPTTEQFVYTFDHLADVVDHLLDQQGITKYSIYIQVSSPKTCLTFRPYTSFTKNGFRGIQRSTIVEHWIRRSISRNKVAQ